VRGRRHPGPGAACGSLCRRRRRSAQRLCPPQPPRRGGALAGGSQGSRRNHLCRCCRLSRRAVRDAALCAVVRDGRARSHTQLEETLKQANAWLERFRAEGVKNQIAGEAVDAADGATFDTISPIDLKPLAKVARGKAEDIDRAAKAAKAAFPEWSRMDGDKRKK